MTSAAGAGTGSAGHSLAKIGLWSALPYAACLFFFIAQYFRIHHLASFTFPVPWVDESQYPWQAIHLARGGSLQAPEVTSRPLFVMPPLYMVFIGAAFKVFGVSLGLARFVAALLVAASFFSSPP